MEDNIPLGLVTAISAWPLPWGPFMRTNSILWLLLPAKSPIIIRWATLLLRLAWKWCKLHICIILKTQYSIVQVLVNQEEIRILQFTSIRLYQRIMIWGTEDTHPGIIDPLQSIITYGSKKDNSLASTSVICCHQLHTHHLTITH